jgi:hypothetical protein
VGCFGVLLFVVVTKKNPSRLGRGVRHGARGGPAARGREVREG